MSKICIAVLREQEPLNNYIKEELYSILEKNNLYCFFEVPYHEPFFNELGKFQMISISNHSKYDNCEMFLLPDGCLYNGKTNPVSFSYRMSVLEDITSALQKSNYRVEWFIGDSGTPYHDFKILQCGFSQISEIIEQHFFDFETAVQTDLHILIKDISD